jgi:hypothetical protein
MHISGVIATATAPVCSADLDAGIGAAATVTGHDDDVAPA